jgi:hypothetical protein
MSPVAIIMPDDTTMLEVAEIAAAANVVLVERGGRMAWCGAANVPDGWHQISTAIKSREARP